MGFSFIPGYGRMSLDCYGKHKLSSNGSVEQEKDLLWGFCVVGVVVLALVTVSQSGFVFLLILFFFITRFASVR